MSVSSSLGIIIYVVFASVTILPPVKVGAQPVKFREIVDAAKREAGEGVFSVWASNPRKNKTWQALVDSFKKKYKLEALRFDLLPLHPRDTVGRVVAETRAGRSGPDVVFGAPNSLEDIDREGLLEPFDWVTAFREEFPGIKEAQWIGCLRS